MGQLDNKVAIVTGAGGGFGEGIAQAYVHEGAKVVVADINGEAAQRVAAALGDAATAFTCDVSQRASVDAMVAHCVKTFGIPHIVVNNAGTTHKNQSMLEVDEATFDRVYATNVKSLYWGALAVVPVLKKQGQGGAIINIASTAAARPRPGLTWYAGTKGAAVTITKGMAAELAPDRIRVTAINPVMGQTGLFTDFLPGDNDEATRARIIATIPLGRFSTPLDIAKACAFLASADAEFITGVALEVDGGRCI